ncbi:hypothetical protein G3N57_00375 [Paraburkholderia sp. Se-20369]|nr:hypothetical protein [Paraburkholderia sp. Se-20369]
MESLDITAEPIATEVAGKIATHNGMAVLREFKAAAERLDYLFVKQPNPYALTVTEKVVLGEALDDVDDGFAGRTLVDELLVALAYEGVYLHMGPSTPQLLREQKRRSAETRSAVGTSEPPPRDAGASVLELVPPRAAHCTREPMRFVVDVTNDQVVVSGKGTLVTYYWRATPYDNRVARLSIQPARQVVGASNDDTYRVVAGDVDAVHRPPSVLADNLTESDALALIERIHDGVKALLGVGAEPAQMGQLDDAIGVAAAVDHTRRSMISKLLDTVTTAVSRSVWITVCAVSGAAVVGAAVLLLPIAYRIGHHVGAHLIDIAIDAYPALQGLLS